MLLLIYLISYYRVWMRVILVRSLDIFYVGDLNVFHVKRLNIAFEQSYYCCMLIFFIIVVVVFFFNVFLYNIQKNNKRKGMMCELYFLDLWSYFEY